MKRRDPDLRLFPFHHCTLDREPVLVMGWDSDHAGAASYNLTLGKNSQRSFGQKTQPIVLQDISEALWLVLGSLPPENRFLRNSEPVRQIAWPFPRSFPDAKSAMPGNGMNRVCSRIRF